MTPGHDPYWPDATALELEARRLRALWFARLARRVARDLLARLPQGRSAQHG